MKFTVGLCLVAALVPVMVLSVGCGEYAIDPANDGCNDRQCTRKITNGELTFCVRGQAEGVACQTDDDCYIHLYCKLNGTVPTVCTKSTSEKVAWIGFVAVGVSVLAFGSYLIPARTIDPGNGLFFQFFMSCGILLVGFVVQMVREAPTFYPYAMLGGMLWCLGNTLAVPALKLISLGLAVSIWGASNMLLGWASGRFGIWDLKKETIEIEWLSYVGVGFAVVAIVILAFVKKSSNSRRSASAVDDYMPAGSDGRSSGYNSLGVQPVSNPFAQIELGTKEDISDYLTKNQMRGLGILLAVVAGCFFGLNFDPPTYLTTNFAHRSLVETVKYSPDGLDYAFSHFFGIFTTATMLLVIFSGFDRVCNLPSLFTPDDYQAMILPGFVCGIGWGIGQTAWFVANTNLGLVVSFPLVALGPSIVASFWSVVLFKEIRGAKNFGLLGMGFLVLAISAACTVVAKEGI